MHQYFIVLLLKVMLLYTSLIILSADGYFGCLHLLAIMNDVATNICLQHLAQTYIFISLGYILGIEFLEHMATL